MALPAHCLAASPVHCSQESEAGVLAAPSLLLLSHLPPAPALQSPQWSTLPKTSSVAACLLYLQDWPQGLGQDTSLPIYCSPSQPSARRIPLCWWGGRSKPRVPVLSKRPGHARWGPHTLGWWTMLLRPWRLRSALCTLALWATLSRLF